MAEWDPSGFKRTQLCRWYMPHETNTSCTRPVCTGPACLASFFPPARAGRLRTAACSQAAPLCSQNGCTSCCQRGRAGRPSCCRYCCHWRPQWVKPRDRLSWSQSERVACCSEEKAPLAGCCAVDWETRRQPRALRAQARRPVHAFSTFLTKYQRCSCGTALLRAARTLLQAWASDCSWLHREALVELRMW